MDFFKSTIKKIFLCVDNSFLIKYYSISIAIFTIFLFATLNSGIHYFNDIYEMIFCAICSILFPFSVLVWNSIINLFFKNSIIILPLVFMVLLKVIKVLLLYIFSISYDPNNLLNIKSMLGLINFNLYFFLLIILNNSFSFKSPFVIHDLGPNANATDGSSLYY